MNIRPGADLVRQDDALAPDARHLEGTALALGERRAEFDPDDRAGLESGLRVGADGSMVPALFADLFDEVDAAGSSGMSGLWIR